MTETRLISDILQTIVHYVIDHYTEITHRKGSDENAILPKTIYRVERQLKDGNYLSVVFLDKGNQGLDTPHPESQLEISLKPETKGHWEVATMELGLTGKFEYIQISFGHFPTFADNVPKTAYGHLNLKINGHDVNDDLRDKLEREYDALLKYVHNSLTEV